MLVLMYNFCLSANFYVTNMTRRWRSTIGKIDKVLIANRGEIACRVMRTARRLGVKTVAVYSEADEHALHVSMADEAYKIGPAPASQSYLRGDKLLQLAKLSNSQAIHPGYGFLSENDEFAEDCQKSGIIFIGPPASAIRDMGIKSTSKAIMAAAGVPIVAGYHGADQTNATLAAEAAKIGFPVMIKAVRGGGGKGMRIAHTRTDFEQALESARTEAQKAFDDSVVLLEAFVTEPRHVEVQVFADMHGNAVHLFERDCSVQRRHQKVIEEAPAPGLSHALRCELGAAAVRAAKAVGYVGAGTVEFILDRNTNKFYFMEMNTRLQVEHPITEMITGTDLVEWQLKVASGGQLPLCQDEIRLHGHAFEARVYAEDPRGGFLPGAGPLLHLSTPEVDRDTRIETGVREGDEVSVHYDPMIAKVIVWGHDRTEALLKLHSKLLEFNVAGVETNVNFLIALSQHREFALGNVHTNFITNHYDSLFKYNQPNNVQLIQAAVTVVLQDQIANRQLATRKRRPCDPFVLEMGFRPNYHHIREICLQYNDQDIKVQVKYFDDHYDVSTDNGITWHVVRAELNKYHQKQILNCIVENAKTCTNIFSNSEILMIFDNHGKMEFRLPQSEFMLNNDDEAESGCTNRAMAPMPGILDKILISSGDAVKKGDSLFVLIAMKMEYVVKAKKDAIVAKVCFNAGDSVMKDDTIVQFE